MSLFNRRWGVVTSLNTEGHLTSSRITTAFKKKYIYIYRYINIYENK